MDLEGELDVHYIESKIEKSFFLYFLLCNKLSPKASVLRQLLRAPQWQSSYSGLSEGGSQVSEGLLSCKGLMGPEEFTSKLTSVADDRRPQEAPLSGMLIKVGTPRSNEESQRQQREWALFWSCWPRAMALVSCWLSGLALLRRGRGRHHGSKCQGHLGPVWS